MVYAAAWVEFLEEGNNFRRVRKENDDGARLGRDITSAVYSGGLWCMVSDLTKDSVSVFKGGTPFGNVEDDDLAGAAYSVKLL